MSMHPDRNLFKEFKEHRQVFIETGTYRGDAVQLALEAGFEEVWTMDIDPAAERFVWDRFNMHNNPGLRRKITPLTGDSSILLGKVLGYLLRPAVIWLDAHAQYLEDELPGPNPYPLMQELIQIQATGRQDDVILIDDMLHLTHPDITGWTRLMIEDQLLNINPAFRLNYFANPVKNSILVAYP